MGRLKLTRPAPAGRHAGFVLVMTLIVLVVLTISALSMLLLMKSGISASGNIAFRQAAVRVADLAVEDARTWLLSQSTTTLLTTTTPTADGQYYYSAYYETSTSGSTFDPKTYDFVTLGKKYVSGSTDTFSGYKIYYVIHRMADTPGVDCTAGGGCVKPPTAAATNTILPGMSQTGGQQQISVSFAPVYFRVTAKVVGPRYNNRYVQALVY